jgi:hypothetical protein
LTTRSRAIFLVTAAALLLSSCAVDEAPPEQNQITAAAATTAAKTTEAPAASAVPIAATTTTAAETPDPGMEPPTEDQIYLVTDIRFPDGNYKLLTCSISKTELNDYDENKVASFPGTFYFVLMKGDEVIGTLPAANALSGGAPGAATLGQLSAITSGFHNYYIGGERRAVVVLFSLDSFPLTGEHKYVTTFFKVTKDSGIMYAFKDAYIDPADGVEKGEIVMPGDTSGNFTQLNEYTIRDVGAQLDYIFDDDGNILYITEVIDGESFTEGMSPED